jgi:hypothetical protein
MSSSGWRGVATGALALVVLETLVQPSASSRVGSLFALPAKWAAAFLDPAKPAFTVSKASATKSAATSSGSVSTGQLTLPQFGGSSSGGQTSSAGGFSPLPAGTTISA